VLDGEIVKLDDNGRPQFYGLTRRRGPFSFVAFDVLVVNGHDLRRLPLFERKRILRAIVPRRSSSIFYAQHIDGRGCDLFAEVCAHDLEGIVAKHRESRYGADEPRAWINVKNPAYSHRTWTDTNSSNARTHTAFSNVSTAAVGFPKNGIATLQSRHL
jgi:bifunctional non-homologous end joining protein LigD